MFGYVKFAEFKAMKKNQDSETRYFYNDEEISKEDMIEHIKAKYYSRKTAVSFALFLINELVEGISCSFNNPTSEDVRFYDLEEVIIPNTIKVIGEGTFSKCKNFYKIKIPDSVERIEKYAFAYCKAFNGIGKIGSDEDIELPSSVVFIGDEAFAWCDLEYVDIPIGVLSIGKRCFIYNKNLQEVSLPKNLKYLGSECFKYTSVKNVSIGEGLEVLNFGTFSHCIELKEVMLPNSLKVINGACFNNCHLLDYISMSSNIKKFGKNAFYNCYSLKESFV